MKLVAFLLLLVSLLSMPSHRVFAGVQINGDRVTLKTDSAPLIDVLREIAQKAGIAMVLKGKTGQVITAEFDNLPLDEALTNLLRGNPGSALVYGDVSGEKSRLVKAYVILRGDGAAVDETLGYNAGAAGVERGQDIPIAVAEKNLREGSPEDFIQALAALYPKQSTTEGLYSALQNPDPSVRVNALSMLAEMGTGDRAKLALEDAANDTDPMVSGLARRMLGRPSPKDQKPSVAPKARR